MVVVSCECCEVVLLQTVRTVFKVERAELTPVHILHCQVITFILLSGGTVDSSKPDLKGRALELSTKFYKYYSFFNSAF